MPPRKSNVSVKTPEESPAPPPAPRLREEESLGVEDLNLPKSMVQRLAKGMLPPNTQIQKDALLAMSKSATVFVNYLTSCAAEHAQRAGKKTIMPQDVFDAMAELEFKFMNDRLEPEVQKFTSIQADKRNTYRKKVREEKKAAAGGGVVGAVAGAAMMGGAATIAVANGTAMDEDGEPAAKRARRESGAAQSGDDEEGDGDETQDVEDEEVEDDEIEEEVVEEGLTEDPLEDKEDRDEDDEMADGDESD